MKLNQRTVYSNSIPLDSKKTYYRFRNTSGRFAIQKVKQNSDDVIFDTDELTEDIIDNSSKDPFDLAVQTKLEETTTMILSSLTPREERVLRMRFGIGMNSDHTLEEVSQQLGVCRDRIAQIQAKALRKLKHETRASALKGFLKEVA